LENHEQHVRLVLDKLKEIEFYAKLKKCEFHQTKVESLDYIISGNGIRMDLCKVQTIINWATQISICDIQCFLGFINFSTFHCPLLYDIDFFYSIDLEG
jgi:hypothetical protein